MLLPHRGRFAARHGKCGVARVGPDTPAPPRTPLATDRRTGCPESSWREVSTRIPSATRCFSRAARVRRRRARARPHPRLRPTPACGPRGGLRDHDHEDRTSRSVGERGDQIDRTFMKRGRDESASFGVPKTPSNKNVLHRATRDARPGRLRGAQTAATNENFSLSLSFHVPMARVAYSADTRVASSRSRRGKNA